MRLISVCILTALAVTAEFQEKNKQQIVDIKDHLYTLSLRHHSTHVCTAALIRFKFALTAGHCVYSSLTENLSVLVNSTDINTGEQIIDVANSSVHENFRFVGKKPDFDIAVLTLSSDFMTFHYATLPSLGFEVKLYNTLYMTGWCASKSPEPNLLKRLRVKIVETMFCNGAFDNKTICTEGNGSPCPGNSGSPAMFRNILVGIHSWGRRTSTYRSFAVLTNVSHKDILPYIYTIIKY